MAKAGQHKGKEKKNTLILEAICDPDTYIWYSFLREPGSLNDLNIKWHDGTLFATRTTLFYLWNF